MLTVLAFTIVACTNTQKDAINNDAELKQLVMDYGNAMNALAKSTKDFGGDSETQWAIDTVNTIWMECQKKPFDVLVYLSEIAVMEKYVAYGIDYVPIIFYTSKYFKAYQQGTYTYRSLFDDSMHLVDSLHNVVIESEDWFDYFLLHTYSLNLMDIYYAIANDLNGIEMQPEMPSFYTIDMITSIYSSDILNKEYYAWRLDGAAFFKTYTQWIRRTLDDPNNLDQKLFDWAYTMDDNSQPIITAMKGNGEMPTINEKEHIHALKLNIKMYVDLIGMLESNFKRLTTEQH